MKLTTLLLADHASVDASGKLYVNGGGITRITAPLPATLPFLSLLAQFLVDDEDLLRQRVFQIRITGPDDHELAELPQETIGPLERKGKPYEDQMFTVVAQIGGLPIQEPGRYRFELLIDGDVAGEIGVAVVPAPSS